MSTQSEIYAGFFGLVHDLLEADKRRSRSCTNQLIAPFDDGRLPSAQEFRPVRCQSLSLEGMDYFDEQPPMNERIILMLGANRPVFLIAAILHHTRVPSKDGTEYLMNCRFIGRLSAEKSASASLANDESAPRG